jgi:hypothetical protein
VHGPHLDPIAWTTGRAGESNLPFSTRLHSDIGAQATLEGFFRLCDARMCAFGPDSAARFKALGDRLKAHPLVVTNPDGSSTEINYVEGFPAVACADSDNPHTYSAWSSAGAAGDAATGYFGRIWTWASSICAAWPHADADRYTGPFTNRTANPVLVIGNQFDPATRYEGAVTASQLLPNSRLLTVHGWGHTSLFLSSCADAVASNYLVSLALPPVGTVCEQDHVPFSMP